MPSISRDSATIIDPGGRVRQAMAGVGPTATRAGRLRWILLWIGSAGLLTWSLLAILFVGGGVAGIGALRWLLALVWLALGALSFRRLPEPGRWIVPIVMFAVALVGLFLVRPSHERDWSDDQARTAWAQVDGSVVTFHNIRDFRYRSQERWEPDWRDGVYDVAELQQAYFVVEHFSESQAVAHTLVSFRFSGDRFLAFSVEIRKEKGESFSPLRGLFRQFELTYVVADERDVLQLRTHHRDSRVHIHPIKARPDRLVAYFMDLVRRVNELHSQPAFYNTLTSSCTTNLASHLETVTDRRLMWDYRVYLPGYSSALAWETDLLDSDLSLQQTLERDLVNAEQIGRAGDREDYSLLIRQR